jgi:hypothetical protein
MNFLGNELTPLFTFQPILRTREQIEVSVYFVVYMTAKSHFFIPFVDDGPYQNSVLGELDRLGRAAAHRWALQYPSAEDCLTAECYASLEQELRGLTSPEFHIERVTVVSIIPLTARIEKPAPKEPLAKRVITELTEDAEVAQEIHNFKASWTREHVEFSETKAGQRMQDKIDAKAYEILLSRRK